MWRVRYCPITGDDGESSIRFDQQHIFGDLTEVWIIGGAAPGNGAYERGPALTRKAMRALWQVVEQVNAWHWAGQDYGCDVLDGCPWVLEMRHGEHRATVRGNCLDAAPRGFRRLAYALHCATGGAFMKREFEGPSSEIELSFPIAGQNYEEWDRLRDDLRRVAELSDGPPRCSHSFIESDNWGLGFRCDDPVVFLKAVQSALQTLGLWEHLHANYRPVWEDDWQEVSTDGVNGKGIADGT
jgi:hypothetical protein